MRAVRVHGFGGKLRVDDVDEPVPAPGEVLVEVAYAGVDPLDVWVVAGQVGGNQPLPFTPGVEAAGHVDGRPVAVYGGGLGVARQGLYAERAAVPADVVVDVPDGVDLEQAAALGVVGVTAWRVVRDVGRVGAGDRVLVLGASGGVGSVAVQLAKAAGATVWGQTANPDKAGFVTGLGADRAVVADAPTLAGAVAELAPTVVCDPLGGDFTMAAVTALAPRGRLVLYGASAGGTAQIELRELYRKGVAILTYGGITEPPGRPQAGLHDVLAEVAAGRLRVPIDAVLPLEQAGEAHRRILDREVRGKLLLDPRR